MHRRVIAHRCTLCLWGRILRTALLIDVSTRAPLFFFLQIVGAACFSKLRAATDKKIHVNHQQIRFGQGR